MENQDEQEFQDAAAEFAKGVSAYMRSTAEHLCEVSRRSAMLKLLKKLFKRHTKFVISNLRFGILKG